MHTGKWEVWNRHPMGYTHREKYKGDDVIINADDYVLMDYEEAVQFKGQMPSTGIMKNAQGVQDPKSYKCIELKPHSGDAVNPVVAETVSDFVCNYDGKKFLTEKELDEHINKYYADQVFRDPALERDLEMAKKLKGQ